MTSRPPASFGDYLKAARTERGYSARQLAQQIGVNVTQITRYEDGTYLLPPPDLLLTLIDALDLDIHTAVDLLEPYRRLFDRLIERHHP